MVLERDDGRITGIEVKASASVGIGDFKGLLHLADFAPKYFQQGIVFYGGDKILPFSRNDVQLTAVPLGLLYPATTGSSLSLPH